MIADCQPSLFPWGDASITWIAQFRQPWLNHFMRTISHLGDVGALLFTVALSYWLWNKRLGKILCYGLFATLMVNLWIKGWVKECRPPPEFWMESVNNYSFPSGHAQVGILLWWGFAYYLRSRLLSWVCFVIGIMIVVSRPYLGVHYPQDVIAGLLFALLILGFSIWFEKKPLPPISFPLWGQALLFLMFLGLYQISIYDPYHTGPAIIGSCFGFWLGCQIKAQSWPKLSSSKLISVFSQLSIGIGGLLLFWKGIDQWRQPLPLPLGLWVKTGQYALLGWWIAYGAPALSEKLNKSLLK